MGLSIGGGKNTVSSLTAVNKTALLQALAVILVLASVLRLWGIGYGLPQLYHPDEPNKIVMAQRMFKTGDLDPHYFKKPTLFIYLNAALYVPYHMAGRLLGVFTTPDDVPEPTVICAGVGYVSMPSMVLMGRLMTVVVSLLTIVIVYYVGRQVSRRKSVGLLSALLLSVSPTHVYHSRFMTVNSYLTAAVLGVAWCALRVLRFGKKRDYLLAGALAGLAVSFKYPGVWAALLIPVAHFLRCDSRGIRDARLYLALATMPVAFLIGTPYALLDWPKFIEDVLYEYTHYSTGSLGMEGTPLRWYLSYAYRVEGLVAFLAVVAIVVGWLRKRKEVVLLSSFVMVYFVFIAIFTVRNGRTFLPIVPFLCILAALALAELSDIAQQHSGHKHWLLAGLIILSAFGLARSLERVFRSGHHLTQEDARATAAVWVNANIPEGSKLAVESYSTFVSPERYNVLGVGMIPENPLEWYLEEGFDFLIFGEGMYGRFYADPDRYAEYIDQYERFFGEFRLLKVVADGGYEVRIYRTELEAEFSVTH